MLRFILLDICIALLLPGRRSFDALMSLSRKRRILYVATACLCALLLVIIIMLLAFWPEVPFHLRAPLCLQRECVESSRQLLLWANTTKSACHETYDWACGNFADEYANGDYYVIKRGEWNYKTYNEYQGKSCAAVVPSQLILNSFVSCRTQRTEPLHIHAAQCRGASLRRGVNHQQSLSQLPRHRCPGQESIGSVAQAGH